MRRLLLRLSVGLVAVLAVAAFGLYGVSQGWFEGPPVHPPEPEPPILDTAAPLPTPDEFALLARTDQVAFLRASLLRYRREVHGYRAVLDKQERLRGKLGPPETIAVTFREDPFGVLLRWVTPPAGMADRALYVAGQNGGKALARGKFMHLVHHRDPYSKEAMDAGRYALPDFGIAKGTERTLRAWQAAEERGTLKVEYLGVRPVPEAGGVECHVFRRTCDPPEEEGVVTVEVSFDTAHWLQVGNVLTLAGDQRLASYFFRDVVPNPIFPPNEFAPSAVK